MKTRIVLAPQWAGTPQSDFYPWLCEELVGEPIPPEVTIVPPPERPPTPETYSGALLHELRKADAEALAKTLLIGHSVGSHALLHALSRLGEGKVGGLLIVAGWWDVNPATWSSFGLPWDQIRVWLDAELDDAAAASRTAWTEVLLSTDDPIPASSAEDTGAIYERRLGAKVSIVEGRKHFNAREEPDVWAMVKRALATSFAS